MASSRYDTIVTVCKRQQRWKDLPVLCIYWACDRDYGLRLPQESVKLGMRKYSERITMN